MMKKKLKVAIIGGGGISSSHHDSWAVLDTVELVGVVDVVPKTRERRAAEWGIPAYATLEELVNNAGVDIIDICTPEHVHFELCKQGYELGLNILSEKILTVNMHDGLELAQLARTGKVLTGVNYNYHYFPVLRYLYEAVNGDGFGHGKVKTISLNTHSFCFHHLLQAVLWIMGTPKSVFASGVERDWPEAFFNSFKISDDLIYIPGKAFTGQLFYDDHTIVNITSSYVQSLSSLPFQYVAAFEDGAALEATGLNWGGDMTGRLFWLPDGENLVPSVYGGTDRGNGLSFRYSIQSVAESFLAGRPAESTWEDGYTVMVVDNALLTAGHTGKVVTL
jgi:predicted dehydrogenase